MDASYHALSLSNSVNAEEQKSQTNAQNSKKLIK